MKSLLTLSWLFLLVACKPGVSEFDHFVKVCSKELDAKQAALERKTAGYERFHWSQDSGLLVFSSPGKPTLIAETQFVGDVSKRSKKWLWAWANPTVADRVKAGSARVRELGRVNGYPKLFSAEWDAVESDGWCMAAIQAHVLGSQAAYRTEGPNGYTFMVLDNLRQAPEGFIISAATP